MSEPTKPDGMTLRDDFAAQAIASIGEDVHSVLWHLDHDNVDGAKRTAALIAQTAYVLADAMLAERDK